MRVRYFSFLSLTVAAAFLVVATAGGFTLPEISGLALGIGVGTLMISLGVAMRYREDSPSAAAAGAAALVSSWMILASQVFTLPLVHTLTFASALAIGVLGVAGLIAHELRTERVVHSLEVRDGERQSGDPRERIAA